MIFKFWELIIILAEAFLFLIFMNKKMKLKDIEHFHTSISILQVLFTLIGCILLFTLNSLELSTITTITVSFLFHLLFAHIFFCDCLFNKILWTTLYTVFGILSDALTVSIPIYFLHLPKEMVLTPSGIIRIIFTLLYILIFSLFIVLTLNWNNNTFKLSNTERFVFSAISLLCIVIEEIVLASIINSSHILQKHELYSQALVFILVFFLFFSLVFYVYNLGIQKERNTFLLEENLLTKLNTQQYEQITVQVEELRIIRHDITNHLNALSMLINEKEYVEASNYLSTITNDLSIHHNLLSSGNVAIDSIISCKIIQAQSKNIPINYTIQLPAFLPLDNVDLCSLLGNLLDNSIEACEKIKRPHKRSILLNIKPFNGMLSIKLTNSSNGIYNMDVSGNMLSTKDNYSEHGLGTKQINKIIKKYNGFSRFSPEADAFTAEILFPLTNPTTYETEV